MRTLKSALHYGRNAGTVVAQACTVTGPHMHPVLDVPKPPPAHPHGYRGNESQLLLLT